MVDSHSADGPKLIRLALFCVGIYFFFTDQWNAGFGCFTVLLWWKLGIVEDRLQELRDAIRGLTDDELMEAIKQGTTTPPLSKNGLGEIVVLLRDIRNNQMNRDGGL